MITTATKWEGSGLAAGHPAFVSRALRLYFWATGRAWAQGKYVRDSRGKEC
jgi:hypothetical protein